MTFQAGSLDSHITRLLVTTKQLLQGLDAWAQGGISEDAVSFAIEGCPDSSGQRYLREIRQWL